ncbi:MAG: UbiH/UbiF/VisC/COQ6 family ubiquinone biosynthesis hydroxylase [Rickettsiales bacterium]|nr:UbiH/UbiF/VisC/COQ6 family ubiquinone biosynthesis hydroxylase [Rickettsiales bacterium]
MATKTSETHTDLIIIGGGLVGLTMALAAARSGIRCHVIEKHSMQTILDSKTVHDGRVSAIAAGSMQLLKEYGIWDDVVEHAGPINDIRVVDQNHPHFLHFSFENHDTGNKEPMGYMMPNSLMHKSLIQQAMDHEQITICDQHALKHIQTHSTGVTVTLDKGTPIHASLIIGADGRNSYTRNLLSINHTIKDYQQVGIVCNVWHERNHHGTAVEHFMPSGPFAILPMQGGHHSSLVWTETTSLAEYYLKLDSDSLLEHLKGKFGSFLGSIKIDSGIFSYPLNRVTTDTVIANRGVIIGDAAHGIHPIAGQGYNLAVRDIKDLTDTILNTASLGLDFGKHNVLKDYEAKRRFDVGSMLFATDKLNSLFVNQNPLIKTGRRAGLAVVNQIPPLKNFFMKQAMGL